MSIDRPDPIDDLLRSGASAFPEAPAPDASRLAALVRTSRRRDQRTRGALLAGATVLVAGGAALVLRDPGEQVDSAGPETTDPSDPGTTIGEGNAWGLSPGAWSLVCGVGIPPSPLSYEDARVIAVWSNDPTGVIEDIEVTAADPVDSSVTASELTTSIVGDADPSRGDAGVWLPEAALAGPDGVAGLFAVPDVDSTGAAVFADQDVVLQGGLLGEDPYLLTDTSLLLTSEGDDGSTVVIADLTVGGLLDLALECRGLDGPTDPPDPASEPDVTTAPPTAVVVDPGGTTTAPPTTAPPGDVLCRIEGDGNGTIGLWVSNQSFAEPSVELEVLVDGRTVAHDTYDVEGQHTFVQYEVIWSDDIEEIVVRWDDGEVAHGPVEAGNGVIVQYWGSSDPTVDPVQVEVIESCADFAIL